MLYWLQRYHTNETRGFKSVEAKFLLAVKRASAREDEVVINTEWTINGAAGPLQDLDLITRWDIMLDEATDAPGFQPFEYMVVGRYLGEPVRLVLVDWFTCGRGIIEASLPHLLGQRNALTTAFLATIVAPAEDPSVLTTYLNSNLESAAVGNWTWTAEFLEALHELLRSSKEDLPQ